MENIYVNEKPLENGRKSKKKRTGRWTATQGEDIYANDEVIHSHYSPNTAVVKGAVCSKAVRGLVLLCFLLLVGMVALLCLLVTRDVQLTQLNTNLTNERDRLLDKLNKLHTFHVQTGVNGGCRECWQKVGGSCYYVSTEKRSWESSRQYCLALGADLVVINSQEEQEFVAKLDGKIVWIGLSDQAAEGVWEWVDTTPLGKSYWNEQQPDNNGQGADKEEDCVESYNLYPLPLNKWNDMSCNHANIFICEIII